MQYATHTAQVRLPSSVQITALADALLIKIVAEAPETKDLVGIEPQGRSKVTKCIGNIRLEVPTISDEHMVWAKALN
jgi:hypothetical protein